MHLGEKYDLEKKKKKKNEVRRPGVEPGSTAWKATMLTVTPPTLLASEVTNKLYKYNKA